MWDAGTWPVCEWDLAGHHFLRWDLARPGIKYILLKDIPHLKVPIEKRTDKKK